MGTRITHERTPHDPTNPQNDPTSLPFNHEQNELNHPNQISRVHVPDHRQRVRMIQSCIDLSVSILRAHTKGQGKKVSKLRKECERQLDMLESLPNAYTTVMAEASAWGEPHSL